MAQLLEDFASAAATSSRESAARLRHEAQLFESAASGDVTELDRSELVAAARLARQVLGQALTQAEGFWQTTLESLRSHLKDDAALRAIRVYQVLFESGQQLSEVTQDLCLLAARVGGTKRFPNSECLGSGLPNFYGRRHWL